MWKKYRMSSIFNNIHGVEHVGALSDGNRYETLEKLMVRFVHTTFDGSFCQFKLFRRSMYVYRV